MNLKSPHIQKHPNNQKHINANIQMLLNSSGRVPLGCDLPLYMGKMDVCINRGEGRTSMSPPGFLDMYAWKMLRDLTQRPLNVRNNECT